MISAKIVPGVGAERFVARVVNRLNTGDVGDEPRLMRVDMLDELGFRVRTPRDQDRLGGGECCGEVLVEILVLGRVTGADRADLVVDVARRVIRTHDDELDLGSIEVKDARFMMINADDGVIEAGHGEALCCCIPERSPGRR